MTREEHGLWGKKKMKINQNHLYAPGSFVIESVHFEEALFGAKGFLWGFILAFSRQNRQPWSGKNHLPSATFSEQRNTTPCTEQQTISSQEEVSFSHPVCYTRVGEKLQLFWIHVSSQSQEQIILELYKISEGTPTHHLQHSLATVRTAL